MTTAAPAASQLIPAFGLVYGPIGSGKTTDMLYSFPRGLFVASPNALKPWAMVGWKPTSSNLLDLDSIISFLATLEGKPPAYDAIVIDDVSLVVERTTMLLAQKLGGYDLWGAVRERILLLGERAQRCHMHVVMTAHEQPPRAEGGWQLPGGPRLPGRGVIDLPSRIDFVLRVQPEQKKKGWPCVYENKGTAGAYVTKDRHNAAFDGAPMNLAEILRYAGYQIRRAIPWQEEVVEKIARALLANPDKENEVLKQAVALVREKHSKNDKALDWTLRDAMDRATLRRVHAKIDSIEAKYGIT